jgi:general secretion pathway protein D
VLIESVILEVNLDNRSERGVDWVQRAMVAYGEKASGSRQPEAAFAGGGGGGTLPPLSPLTMTSSSSFPQSGAGGLTYYLTFMGLNLDMVVRLAATDTRTEILSSPVVLTAENKPASIEVTTEQYFYKGKKYVGEAGGNPIYEDDVERQKVGLKLKVTPRVNENKFVVMEIVQQIDNVSGTQTIGDDKWPIVSSRNLDATIAVRSGETIVMGGLVDRLNEGNRTKVPVLGDIPFLGIPFRSSDSRKAKREVMVFITPFVYETVEDLAGEAARRREALNTRTRLWEKSWSGSKLASPGTEEGPQGWRGRPAVRGGATNAPAAPAAGTAPGPVTNAAPAEVRGGEVDGEVRRLLEVAEKRWGDTLGRVDARVGGEAAKR